MKTMLVLCIGLNSYVRDLISNGVINYVCSINNWADSVTNILLREVVNITLKGMSLKYTTINY